MPQSNEPAKPHVDKSLSPPEYVAGLLDDLWRHARFLRDLEEIWPELTEKQRKEIEDSHPYRERYHENRANGLAELLGNSLSKLRRSTHRAVRNDIRTILEDWRSAEPDNFKILAARTRNR